MSDELRDDSVACPKCGAQISVSLVAQIPKSQQMVVEVTAERDLLAAKTVGGILTETAKLLVAVAKDMGEAVEVFVMNLNLQPKKFQATLAIVKCDAPTPRPRKAGKR